MIVEVRNYHVKPAQREQFIHFFETQAVPALHAEGISVIGPMLDLENPNRFVWLRCFPSLADRDRMKATFYEGDTWKKELEAVAMPMLDSYDFTLCETSPGCVYDRLQESA